MNPVARRIRALLTVVCLAVLAGPVHAGTVKFAWNECRPEGGTSNRYFACDTNQGATTAIGSFMLEQDMPDFVAVEVSIDVMSVSPSLPAWWQYVNSGSCRQTALSVSGDFSARPHYACSDPFATPPVGGVAAYCTQAGPCLYLPPQNGARIRLALATQQGGPVLSGVEYYAFSLRLAHTKTVGTGSCAGCSEPVCLMLSEIRAVAVDYGQLELCYPSGEYPGDAQSMIGWQCGQWSIADPFGPVCGAPIQSCATPARNRTWGQVKSLWR